MSENTNVNVEIQTAETAESQDSAPNTATENTEKKSHMEKSAKRVRRDIDRADKQIEEYEAKIAELRDERRSRLAALQAFELLPDISGELLSAEERSELAGNRSTPGQRVRNTLKLSEVIVDVLSEGPNNLRTILDKSAEQGFLFGGKDRSNYQRVSSEVAKLVEAGKVERTETRGVYQLKSEQSSD